MNVNKIVLPKLAESNGNFKRREKYVAIVKSVHSEGVYVDMPGDKGSGMISPCCWGKGKKREVAMAALAVGDELEVVVKSYHEQSMTLSLVLASCQYMLIPPAVSCRKHFRPARKPAKVFAHKAAKARKPVAVKLQPVAKKPAYRLIPSGSTLLIDTANVIGLLGQQKAAYKLSAIENALNERGYKALFFIECRALDWTCHNQDSKEDVDALEVFCGKQNVSKVGGDADLPILQTANEITGSVCVTRDRFADYRETYPEIVGTERHRSFSVVTLADRMLLTIVGLHDAIVIENEPPKTVVSENPFDVEACDSAEEDSGAIADEDVVVRPANNVPAVLTPHRKGLLGVGDVCRARGEFEKAISFYGRVAKKNPTAFYDIASIYDDEMDGRDNHRKASKFMRLGHKAEKKLRQCAMRRARLSSEVRRTGLHVRGLMRAA